MKIGIVTLPLRVNYGGILQNYALQTVLKRIGHDVWTIDYYRYTWLGWADCIWRVMAHKILGRDVQFPLTPLTERKREFPLRRFVEKNITLTTPRTKRIERKTVERYAFEAFVVGSDQVWRPLYNAEIDKMFLSIAKGMNVRRVAYAASFGTDEWKFTPKQTKVCAPLAQKFDGISVREVSGVDLCKKHLNVDATHVLDPTLLLTAEDYMKVCEKEECRKPFVFAYILDITEEKEKDIKTFAAGKGLPYQIVSADNGVSADDSVEKWLSNFRDAAYVITDSFHGTAFSINFNKDFFVYLNKKRGNSRFDSLLSLFGLKHRIVEGSFDTTAPIDWHKVNTVLDAERVRSMKWLEDVLL